MKELQSKIQSASFKITSAKYIIFSANQYELRNQIDNIHTIDDFRHLVKYESRECRPDNEDILKEVSLNDLYESRYTLESFRELDDRFSVTVSRYKNQTLNTNLLTEQISSKIENNTDFKYEERESDNFDIKIHCEKNNVIISTRIQENPSYYRDYKNFSRLGSIRPTIAASLLYLVKERTDRRLVDNFCGSGTILCEGIRQNLTSFGGDIDSNAVRYTKSHVRCSGQRKLGVISKIDARNSKLPSNYYDIAVSNLPWGHHHKQNTKETIGKSIEEYSRILKNNGGIVLLTPDNQITKKYLRSKFDGWNIWEQKLGYLGQHPYIICAYPDGLRDLDIYSGKMPKSCEGCNVALTPTV